MVQSLHPNFHFDHEFHDLGSFSKAFSEASLQTNGPAEHHDLRTVNLSFKPSSGCHNDPKYRIANLAPTPQRHHRTEHLGTASRTRMPQGRTPYSKQLNPNVTCFILHLGITMLDPSWQTFGLLLPAQIVPSAHEVRFVLQQLHPLPAPSLPLSARRTAGSSPFSRLWFIHLYPILKPTRSTQHHMQQLQIPIVPNPIKQTMTPVRGSPMQRSTPLLPLPLFKPSSQPSSPSHSSTR